jgi:outer membrane protein OmpA-like peptidoglycan-associated protein
MKCVVAMVSMLFVVAVPGAAQEGSDEVRSSASEVSVGSPPSPDETSPDENYYPLERRGGIAVSSADLAAYLADLQERATAWTFLLTFPDLLFAVGSARIDVLVERELMRMAEFLRTHPDTTARIVGYTDDRGSTLSNMSLAEERASAVRSHLIDLGIDADRLSMISRGEARPERDNETPGGRDNNRRVQVFVQKPVAR